MYKGAQVFLPSDRQLPCKILLLVSWSIGLICGIAYAFQADSSFSSLMHSAALSPVSIVSLLIVLFLPFLISAIAVFLSRPVLLMPLAFTKAFSFGACAFAADLAFSSAGWLLRSMLMFSDLLTVPVLIWFWLRCLKGDRFRSCRDLAICAGFIVLIGNFDFYIVSPFLAMLYS